MEAKIQQDSDRDQVGRTLQGDRAAFGLLVEKYHPRIFRLVEGILGDWQRSEDVCQEVFVSAYLKLSHFGFRSAFSTWLYRIAVNAALKARDQAARRRVALNLENIRAVAAVEDKRPADLEGAEVLSKLLRPLPPQLRAVVLLKEKEGLSYKEIAAITGSTPGAVEQRLYRAFTQLRDVWKGRMAEFGLEEAP